MSELSNYLGVFRAAGPDERRRVTKRNRQPVSCVLCRQKKLKCDRQQPCGSCVKRGESTSCEFGPSPAAVTAVPAKSREKTRSEAQARLQKLEEMVNGLIKSRVDNPSSDNSLDGGASGVDVQEGMQRLDVSSSLNKLRDSTGYFLRSEDTEASYVGPTHWIAVLEGIHDLRGYLENEATIDSAEEPQQIGGIMTLASADGGQVPGRQSNGTTSSASAPKQDLILGPYEPLTVEAAMEALPEPTVCANLLSLYFTNKFFAVPFLHSKKFQRDYNAFRENPHGTSFMFISVVFSILCVASGIINASGKLESWPDGVIDARKYMVAASQAIVTGEYLKAQPYVIEALLLHTHSKFLRTVDSEPALWSLTGLVVRLAQKMGMHRDSARLSKPLSPFNAEMRRRLWFHCETFDLLMSFQLGMPPIIDENECDVGHPLNLLPGDFDEDSTELPPERPDTEDSPMLFITYKSRLIRLFRRVIRHGLRTTQPAYAETMSIDSDLHRLYNAMPALLRIRPISEASFSDQTADIMKRLMLEMLYLKSLTVLHRNFLTFEKDNPMYARSRETAINASLRMLDLQEEYARETSPGGRIYEERWMMSSLALHDFLMAAMVICLDLSELPQKSPELRTKKIEILQMAYKNWNEKRATSRDACHAANVIAAMLSKVSAQDLVNGKSPVEVVGGDSSSSGGGSGNSGSGSRVPDARDKNQNGSVSRFSHTSASGSEGSGSPGQSRSLQPQTQTLHFQQPLTPQSQRRKQQQQQVLQQQRIQQQVQSQYQSQQQAPQAQQAQQQQHQNQSLQQQQSSFSSPTDQSGSDDSPFTEESFELMDLDSLDEMLSDTNNLDWNLMDQYLRDYGQVHPGHFALDSLEPVGSL